jgi:two-component system chemotaxis sensor kinase CheA
MLSIVIVAAGHAAEDVATALPVDRLLGTETIVLRPLPALAPADPIVAGAWLDADGNPRIVLAPEALAAAPHRAQTDLRPAATARPILIVDDSLTTRMLETSILESAGFAVESAVSAEEGLDMARRKDYALFLVDIEMPGMDGFGFVEYTRADAALRHVPCILVSSRDSPEDRRRGEAAGAAAYIVKGDFDQTDFLRRVGRLVQQ